jgi:hypothetical protein
LRLEALAKALQPLPLSERILIGVSDTSTVFLEKHRKKDFAVSFPVFSDPDCRKFLGSGDVQCITVRQRLVVASRQAAAQLRC